MECKKCKKECLETELKDGFCGDCYKKYNGNITKLKTSKNAVAQYLKNWAIASIIIGALLGIIDFVANGSFIIDLYNIRLSCIGRTFTSLFRDYSITRRYKK